MTPPPTTAHLLTLLTTEEGILRGVEEYIAERSQTDRDKFNQ